MEFKQNRFREFEEYEEKNKAFAQRIIKECVEQGFTVAQLIHLKDAFSGTVDKYCTKLLNEKRLDRITHQDNQEDCRSNF